MSMKARLAKVGEDLGKDVGRLHSMQPSAHQPKGTRLCPCWHRHRYHGVFAPNHPLRPAVTAMAVGNLGNQREAADRTDSTDEKPSSHHTSRIAWAKLLARVGEEFPLGYPNCGGDVRLIRFITQPGPIRKILEHVGELLEPPDVSPARGPPVAWDDLVRMTAVFSKPRPKTCP